MSAVFFCEQKPVLSMRDFGDLYSKFTLYAQHMWNRVQCWEYILETVVFLRFFVLMGGGPLTIMLTDQSPPRDEKERCPDFAQLGNKISIIVPCHTLDFTWISPLCASTMVLAMLIPSPDPSVDSSEFVPR